MPSSGMLRRVTLVITDGTDRLAVTGSNCISLQRASVASYC
jgi:hypothetical protein